MNRKDHHTPYVYNYKIQTHVYMTNTSFKHPISHKIRTEVEIKQMNRRDHTHNYKIQIHIHQYMYIHTYTNYIPPEFFAGGEGVDGANGTAPGGLLRLGGGVVEPERPRVLQRVRFRHHARRRLHLSVVADDLSFLRLFAVVRCCPRVAVGRLFRDGRFLCFVHHLSRVLICLCRRREKVVYRRCLIPLLLLSGCVCFLRKLCWK